MELQPVTLKVWRTGTSHVITVPQVVMEMLDIEPGDKLKILIQDVKKDVANRSKRSRKPK